MEEQWAGISFATYSPSNSCLPYIIEEYEMNRTKLTIHCGVAALLAVGLLSTACSSNRGKPDTTNVATAISFPDKTTELPLAPAKAAGPADLGASSSGRGR